MAAKNNVAIFMLLTSFQWNLTIGTARFIPNEPALATT